MRHLNARSTRRIAAALAASALVFGVAACADDSATDTQSDDAAISAAPDGTFAGKKAEGTPIKIGVINSEDGPAISQPEGRIAAEAAVKYANDNLGGIGGHPIETVICKSKEDTSSAADCANQMVEQKVAAVTVLNSAQGDVMEPIIAGAGIAYTGYNGVGGKELTSDSAFFWTGGFPGILTDMAKYAKQQGHDKATLFVTDNTGIVAATQSMGKPAFEASGVDLTITPIPLGTPDASSQVAAGVKDDPGMVGLVGDATMCSSTLKGLETVQYSGEKVVITACNDDSVIEGAGSALDGSKIMTTTDASGDDDESKAYRAVMAKYAPGETTEGSAQTGYQSMMGLIRAASSVKGEPTPESIITAIRSVKDVAVPLGGGGTMTCDGKMLPGLKAVCANFALVGDIDAEGSISNIGLLK
ncbi:ABC transporter substrate-binding protein [Gordonia liuliyuniae]|uniref:ABC transporter substrate-binding protein n=1 Tax=Gordonia liuliyuniae TaxID=2911517 RepID=A0ABS9IP57_9ACTN|nr:ABC transporter substrate-binding protein [Gordonia liuliyuniae]MCF8587330.1 ABC transporter substrate-binding protein [Gordonia liuliyuniae]